MLQTAFPLLRIVLPVVAVGVLALPNAAVAQTAYVRTGPADAAFTGMLGLTRYFREVDSAQRGNGRVTIPTRFDRRYIDDVNGAPPDERCFVRPGVIGGPAFYLQGKEVGKRPDYVVFKCRASGFKPST